MWVDVDGFQETQTSRTKIQQQLFGETLRTITLIAIGMMALITGISGTLKSKEVVCGILLIRFLAEAPVVNGVLQKPI